MIENIIKSFADNLLEAILITTISDRRCVYANEAALKLLGYSLKEIESMYIFDFVTRDQLKKAREAVKKNRSNPYELDILSKEGELIPVRASGSVLNGFDENYRITNFVDLREIKEKERLLFLQSKHAAMGELINMIAHQWRQPLSYISTSISGLQIKSEVGILEEGELSKNFDEILKSVDFLSQTIDDFRNFNLDNKKLEKVNIVEILENSLQMTNNNCINYNVEMVKDFQEVSDIFILKNELLQTLLTIFKNSIDIFNEKEINRPKIKIDIYEDLQYQYIIIEDNGGGIPINIIDRIFEPYFTTKHSSVGTGLGLYMAKTIIETHCKGEISVSNKNGGACFKIVLPK